MNRHLVAAFAIGTMVFIGLVGVARTVTNWQNWYTLQTEGIVAEAEVVNLRDTLPFLSTFYVEYSYTADGERYNREETIPRVVYQSLTTGDSVEIRYADSSPGFVSLADNNTPLIAFSLTSVAWLFFGVVSAVMYIWYDRRLRKAQQRQQELWDEAMARITEVAARREE